MLGRLRESIADMEASRERVRAQITALEISRVKLCAQQAKAVEIGRPDLADEADRRIQLVNAQIAELTGAVGALDHKIAEVAEAAGRLQAKIDDRGHRPGLLSR
jgi:phage shock protein A